MSVSCVVGLMNPQGRRDGPCRCCGPMAVACIIERRNHEAKAKILLIFYNDQERNMKMAVSSWYSGSTT